MQGKKPTKKQAVIITSNKLNYDNWLIVRDLPHELHLKHRHSDKIRIIKKRTL